MKLLVLPVSVCFILVCFACQPLGAYEEVAPGQLVTSPEDYVGRYVTIKVNFGKIDNVYQPWEHSANLKQDKTIKLFVTPLREISCYADKIPDNEKALGALSPGQELTISGYIKKCKATRKVKVDGERGSGTVKTKVKGADRYVFIIKKIDSVGEAAAPAPAQGQGMRGRRRRRLQ